jgi:hypothetical protein
VDRLWQRLLQIGGCPHLIGQRLQRPIPLRGQHVFPSQQAHELVGILGMHGVVVVHAQVPHAVGKGDESDGP